MKWTSTTIGEAPLKISDGNYSSKYPKKSEFVSHGVPFISANNINNGRVTLHNMKFISPSLHATLKKGHLQQGDVLLVTRGSVGLSAFVGHNFAGANINAQLVLLRPDNINIDCRYLYFVVSSKQFFESVLSFSSGTAQPQLPVGALKKIPISYPPLPTQRKIASILSAYDDLIENNTKRIALLEEMAQRIYREWFVHFRYPGHENVPLVDSPLGKIPKGWKVEQFSKSASFINGFAFKPEHWGTTGRPIIKIAELKNGLTDKTPRCSGDDIPKKYIVQAGDVLFSWSADLDAYIWPHEEGLLNQHIFTVIPSSDFTKEFLYFALRSKMPDFRSLSLGTTMKHIKRSALDHVFFTCPPLLLRDAFENRVIPMLKNVIALTKKNTVLRTTRDLLLPKLISGQLDVEDLDIDVGEPLLEATV